MRRSKNRVPQGAFEKPEPCEGILSSTVLRGVGARKGSRLPYERALRGLVVGRKVFYGAGSRWSGTLASHLYSLFATWEKAGFNLRTALSDYLVVCARLGNVPEGLRPWLSWSVSSARKEFLPRPVSWENTG